MNPQTILACGHCWIEIQLLDEDGIGVPREPTGSGCRTAKSARGGWMITDW
jgi:hypothetical protein